MSWVRCPSAAPIIKNSRQAIYLPDDLIESFFVGFGQRSCCRPEDEETLFRCDNSFLIGGNDITFQYVEHYFQRAVVAEDSVASSALQYLQMGVVSSPGFLKR